MEKVKDTHFIPLFPTQKELYYQEGIIKNFLAGDGDYLDEITSYYGKISREYLEGILMGIGFALSIIESQEIKKFIPIK